MIRWIRLTAAVVVLGGILTGCASTEEPKKDVPVESTDTSSSSGAAAPAGNAITIVATNFAFDQAEYRVKKGEVSIKLDNKEGVHGIMIPGLDLNIQGNGTQKITLNETGEYDILCSVPCGTGHVQMKAKLIVEA